MGEALPQATYDLVKEIFGFSPVRSYGNNENGFLACQVGEEERYLVPPKGDALNAVFYGQPIPV